MSEQQENLTLEQNLERLEQLIDQLGEEDIPLEEAFKTYATGMSILKQCNDQIDKVEKQVLLFTKTGELEEFTDGDTGD